MPDLPDTLCVAFPCNGLPLLRKARLDRDKNCGVMHSRLFAGKPLIRCTGTARKALIKSIPIFLRRSSCNCRRVGQHRLLGPSPGGAPWSRASRNPIDAENYFTPDGAKERVGATIAGMMQVVETNICAHHKYDATRFDNARLGRGSTRVDAQMARSDWPADLETGSGHPHARMGAD